MLDVLDYPVYVKRLPERLQSTEPEPSLLDELSRRHADLADGYANHALEIDSRRFVRAPGYNKRPMDSSRDHPRFEHGVH